MIEQTQLWKTFLRAETRLREDRHQIAHFIVKLCLWSNAARLFQVWTSLLSFFFYLFVTL